MIGWAYKWHKLADASQAALTHPRNYSQSINNDTLFLISWTQHEWTTAHTRARSCTNGNEAIIRRNKSNPPLIVLRFVKTLQVVHHIYHFTLFALRAPLSARASHQIHKWFDCESWRIIHSFIEQLKSVKSGIDGPMEIQLAHESARNGRRWHCDARPTYSIVEPDIKSEKRFELFFFGSLDFRFRRWGNHSLRVKQ